MKFSALVISVAVAASTTSAFTAPSARTAHVNKGSSMLFVEMQRSAPATATTTTTTADVPAKVDTEESSSSSSNSPTAIEEKVAVSTAVELSAAAAAAPKAEPVPVVTSTIPDKNRIQPGRYDTVDRSLAVPFLKRPPLLDGTHAGDFGFDPLGFSEQFDLYTMQEAELRHARLAMLAVVGWPMAELVGPQWLLREGGCAPSVLNGFTVPSFLAVVAVFGAIGFFEYKTVLRRNNDTPSGILHRADMEEVWKYGVAGDYGFDPANLYSSIGDNAYARKGLREVEISHGRSAMLGITAFAAWEALTGHAIVDSGAMFFHPNLALPGIFAAYQAFGYFYERVESDTYIKYKMSSEGAARLENLKIGFGLNNNDAPSAAVGEGAAGLPDVDAILEFPEKAGAFFTSIQDKYNNLEKSYMNNVVRKD
mmetsp:Transcript_19743/g.22593  ORF Transcript_19743/g.22593 Transcript_19743/m.22593 type:complete len:423 (-) Transcript_19743:85-1353(-)